MKMNRTPPPTVVPEQSLPPRSRGREPIPGRCRSSSGNRESRAHFHPLMWPSQGYGDSRGGGDPYLSTIPGQRRNHGALKVRIAPVLTCKIRVQCGCGDSSLARNRQRTGNPGDLVQPQCVTARPARLQESSATALWDCIGVRVVALSSLLGSCGRWPR